MMTSSRKNTALVDGARVSDTGEYSDLQKSEIEIMNVKPLWWLEGSDPTEASDDGFVND